MKFKILIDKITIKENNPDHGSVIVTKGKTSDFFIIGKDVAASEIMTFFSMYGKFDFYQKETGEKAYKGCITGLSEGEAYIVRDAINRFKQTLERVEITEKTIMTSTPCAPKPRYSFEYLPTFVECNSCKGKFDFNYLGSSGGNYDFPEEDNACPICEYSDCCEIEFQSIEEALEEMKI